MPLFLHPASQAIGFMSDWGSKAWASLIALNIEAKYKLNESHFSNNYSPVVLLRNFLYSFSKYFNSSSDNSLKSIEALFVDRNALINSSIFSLNSLNFKDL